jgi:hypothetical protein
MPGLLGNPLEFAVAIASPRQPGSIWQNDPVFQAITAGNEAHEKIERQALLDEVDDRMRRNLEGIYGAFIIDKGTLEEATKQRYVAEFKKFRAWAQEQGPPFLPARATTVATFLHEQLQDGASGSTMRLLAAAISYCHRTPLKPFPDPVADVLVEAIVAASTQFDKQRIRVKRRRKKRNGGNGANGSH